MKPLHEIHVGERTFMLSRMEGQDLQKWLDIEVAAATLKASFVADKRPVTVKDVTMLFTFSAMLVMLATGCSMEFAVNLKDEERAPVVALQDELNGIAKLVNELNRRETVRKRDLKNFIHHVETDPYYDTYDEEVTASG